MEDEDWECEEKDLECGDEIMKNFSSVADFTDLTHFFELPEKKNLQTNLISEQSFTSHSMSHYVPQRGNRCCLISRRRRLISLIFLPSSIVVKVSALLKCK